MMSMMTTVFKQFQASFDGEDLRRLRVGKHDGHLINCSIPDFAPLHAEVAPDQSSVINRLDFGRLEDSS